jgi:hypothetical protein
MVLNQVMQSPAILLVLVIWLAILTFILLRTVRHYRFLISRVKKGDLRSILEEILRKVDQQGKQLDQLEEKFSKSEKQGLKHFQKTGFLRFNPFADTGGDQSFCLSILDGEDSGIVLSSLHSRGQTRLYGKLVKNGKPKDLELSREEEEAIKKAKKGKN